MATSLPTVHLLTTLVRNAAPCPFAMPHAVWFHADGAVLGHFYQPSNHPEFLNGPHLIPHSNSGGSGSSSGGAAAQSALRFTVDWPPEELLQETKGQQQRRGKDRGGEDPETAQRRIRRDVLEMFTTGWSSNRGKQKMHSRRNSGGNGSGLGPKQQRQRPPPPQDGYNSTMMSNASTQQQQRLEMDSTCDIVALLLTPSPPSTQSSSSASSSAPPTMETDFLNLSRLETYCYSPTGTATEALLLRFPFAQQPLATDYRLTVAHLCVSMRTGACISQEVRRCRQPLLLPPTATTPSPEENAPPHADGVAAVQSVSVAERTLLPSHGLSSVPRSTTHRLDLMAAQLFQALGGSSSSRSSKSDHPNHSEEPQPLQLFLVLECDSALKHVSRYFLLGAASAAPYDLKTDKHDADRSITATTTTTTPMPKENKQTKRGGDEISWVIEESQAKPTHSPQRTKSHRNHNSSGSSTDNHRSPPSPSRSAAAADDSHRVRHPSSSSDVPRFLGEGPRYLRDHEVSSLSRTPCWSLSSGAAVRNDDMRSPARSQMSEAKGPVAVEPEAIAMEQTSYMDGLFGTCGWMGGYFVDPPACLVPHLATSRSLVSYGAGQPKLTEDPQRAAAAAEGKPTAAFAQCLSSTALRELFVKRAQQFGPQQRAQRTLSSYANPFAATDQQERVTKLAKQQKARERAAGTAIGQKGHNNDEDDHPQKDDENNLRRRRQLLAPLPSPVSAHRTTFMDRFMEAVGAHPNALREIPATAPRDDGDVDVRSPTSLFSLTSASLYGANGTFSSGGGGAAGLAATSGYFVMTEDEPTSQQQQQPNTAASLTVLQRRRLMTNPPPPLTEVCDAQGGAQPSNSNTIQTTTKGVLSSASASSSPPRGSPSSPSRNQTTQAMYDLLCRLLDLRETTTMFTDAFYAVYSHQHTRGPWTVLALELPTLKAVELLYWAGVVHRLQCAVETTTPSRRKAKITRVNLYVLLPAGRLAALGLLPRLVEHQSEAMQRFVSSMAPQLPQQPQQPAEVALLRPHPAVKECLIQGKRSQQELAHTEETVRSLLKQLARLTAPNLGASVGRPSTADQESDLDDDDEAEDLGDDDAPPQKDSATRTVSSEEGGRRRDAPQRTATTATTTSTTASTVTETSSPPHEDDAPLWTVEEILSKLEQYSVLRALIQKMGAEFPRQL